MNPTVQISPKSLASVEELTAKERAAAARRQAEKPAVEPKPSVPPSYAGSVAEALLSTAAEPEDEAAAVPETVAKLSRDERRSRRCPVPQERQSCELKAGPHLVPASLADKSAGGFSVLIDRCDGLKIGKKVELHTDMGWFKVRIVYINEVARPKNAPPGSDAWFRIGLRRARSFCLF